MESRVRIASARDSAEAALIRSMLEAQGINVSVTGEQHASLLGGNSPMISLDVWVDREDGERAAELIAAMRDGDSGSALDEETDVGEGDLDDYDRDLAVKRDDAPKRDVHWGLELRRRTAIAVSVSFLISFGAGHVYARAFGRGLVCLAIEAMGFAQIGANHALGGAMVLGAILFDAVDSVRLVRRQVTETRLPPAQLRR
jgi:hypothetical protein